MSVNYDGVLLRQHSRAPDMACLRLEMRQCRNLWTFGEEAFDFVGMQGHVNRSP